MCGGPVRLHSLSRKDFLFLKYADIISRDHLTIYGERPFSKSGLSKELYLTCSQELTSEYLRDFEKTKDGSTFFLKQNALQSSKSEQHDEADYHYFAVCLSSNSSYIKRRKNRLLLHQSGELKEKERETKQTQNEDEAWDFIKHEESNKGKYVESQDDIVKMEKGEKYSLYSGDTLGIIMSWPDHEKILFGFVFNIIKIEN